jgi:TonB-dependent starch-binding outer membrane protein SusC
MLKIFYFMFIFSLSCLTLQAQNSIKVKGTVVDYLSSKPVKNVLVSVKNTKTSTIASDNGKFTVEVRSPYSVLVISFPGYQTKEYSLNGRKEVSIVLVPEGIDVGESIVKLPYSAINSKDLNGAYTVIQNSNDRYRDIYQMLQGTVPGLESNAYSGVPGEGVKFNLRGTRSLYMNNEPLIVLD